ncbi:hypothetical protein C2S52_005680 [Perilla frutescens var. hirtella]|nr:hypothetical protein C2S52_005680 [Perilla frutescens var. hirtella]
MGDKSSMMKIGPVGNSYGSSSWDEEGHTNIVQIFISHDEEAINSIQFQYAENGSLVLSKRHGVLNGESSFDVVKLNYPTEYITWIRMRRPFDRYNLCSITFGTNHREYGPFGGVKSNDREFCFNLGQDRQFHGFHGTADEKSIKSIGVYLKPNMTLDFSLNKNVAKVL